MDDASKQRAAVRALRDALQRPMKVPIHKLQEAQSRDPGIKDPVWVCKTTVPAPKDLLIRDVFLTSLLTNADWTERGRLFEQDYVPQFNAEWTGLRADGKVDQAADLSEGQKFENLVRDQESPLTVFYLHGGSLVTGSPSTGRRNMAALCQVTRGRAFSIQYRLAPQNPFPQNLLDVVVAYLYLIDPPPGALHKPISPSSIVVAGESAGAALALGLVQFLRWLRQWYRSFEGIQSLYKSLNIGQATSLLPAGCAFLSPVTDFTGSLPSQISVDMTPDWMVGGPHWHRDYFPADHLWPSNPPRSSIIAEGELLAHCFLSPVSRSRLEGWHGTPPMWFAVGDEASADGIKVVAQMMDTQRVSVKYVRYEGMPHIFPMLLPHLPQTKHCLNAWGQACKDIYEGKADWIDKNGANEVVTVHLGKLGESQGSIDSLTDLTWEEAKTFVFEGREVLMERKNAWKGPKDVKPSL